MKKIGFILMAAAVLFACSDDSEQREDMGAPLYLRNATRVPDGTSIVDAKDSLSPIQIFVTSGNKKPIEGQFIYTPDANNPVTGTWSSTVGVKESTSYIYGFSPATAAAGTISPLSADYSNGAVLTLFNLSAVTGDDICVVVGVEKSVTPTTPNFGSFKFQKEDPNNICILLDHIYAGLNFKFKIGADYHKLRNIKLKKVELQSAQKSVTKATITLTANTTDTNPITSINFETSTISQQTAIYDYENDERPANNMGMELDEEGKLIMGCFAADKTIADHLVLTCTYDVYNKKGTCVREDCVSTNDLSGMSEAEVVRGKKSTIVLTVEPTYLYKLSEDELNNPTITISN